MTTPAWLLLPLLAALVSAGLAGAVIARDPRHRMHQLLGALLAISAAWSLLEVLWNPLHDADTVAALVRLSGLGWPFLGPLVMHFFLELLDDPEDRLRALRRLLPWLYAATGVSALVYAASPWCIERAIPTSWGWSFEFGPYFPVVYLQTSIPPTLALLLWRRAYPTRGSRVERRDWAWGRVVIAGVLCAASLTDAILPMLGIHVPRVGSSSVALLGVLVAVSVTRYGHSLLAPGAFATEILDTLVEGVALASPDGRIRVANPALEELAGAAPGGLLDAPLPSLLPDLDEPPGRVGWRERPATLVRADGEPVPVAVATSPLRDGHGHRLGRVIGVRDLREVVALRERLVTAGRLAAVGELSAGIAREIRQPIARVRAHLAELRHEWESLARQAEAARSSDPLDGVFEEGEELVDESLEGVERIAAIARDVGSFSGLAAARSRVDLRETVDAAVRLARPRARAGVRIDVAHGDAPAVRGVAQELEQVFVNLLLNALHAVESAGAPRVQVTSGGAAGIAWVRVEDEGHGIAPELRARIFDPFFTTKPVGDGTGLGLAISYQIVRAHGGEIRVESAPGRGAVFEVRLPAAGDEDRAAAQPEARERRPTIAAAPSADSRSADAAGSGADAGEPPAPGAAGEP